MQAMKGTLAVSLMYSLKLLTSESVFEVKWKKFTSINLFGLALSDIRASFLYRCITTWIFSK